MILYKFIASRDRNVNNEIGLIDVKLKDTEMMLRGTVLHWIAYFDVQVSVGKTVEVVDVINNLQIEKKR